MDHKVSQKTPMLTLRVGNWQRKPSLWERKTTDLSKRNNNGSI